MIQGNNPGNLRYYSIGWVGELYPDNRGMIIFDNLFNGTRAMMKLIYNMNKKGYNTIRKLIYEYAPPIENNTEGYIKNLSTMMGMNENQIFNFNDKNEIIKLIQSISIKESGESPPKGLISDVYDHLFNGVNIPDPKEDKSPAIALLGLIAGSYFFLN